MKNKRMIFVLNVTLVLALVAATFCMADTMPPNNVISKAKARRIALKEQKGKVEASELEFENKIWIYSLEILGPDKKVHEVNVDALNGKIVSNVVETPNTEAKEKIEDPGK